MQKNTRTGNEGVGVFDWPCELAGCDQRGQQWLVASLRFCATHYDDLREGFREAINNG